MIYLPLSFLFVCILATPIFETGAWDDEEESLLSDVKIYWIENQLKTRQTTTPLETPVIIPWGENGGQIGNADVRARKYILSGMSQQSSSLVMYPYSFGATCSEITGEEEGSVDVSFDGGAFFKLDGVNGLSPSSTSYFNWFNSMEDVQISRGATLYRVGVAVLSFPVPIDPETYEIVEISDSYLDLVVTASDVCAVFKAFDSGFSECYGSISELDKHLAESGFSDPGPHLSFITPKELKEGRMFAEDGTRRFGMFIIPDVFEGRESYIADAIGAEGTSELWKFADNGGLMYTLGKGAAVLDHLDKTATERYFLTNGKPFFNYDSKLDAPDINTAAVALDGCDEGMFDVEPPNLSPETLDAVHEDLLHRSLCFALKRDSAGAPLSMLRTVYEPLTESLVDSGFVTVEWFGLLYGSDSRPPDAEAIPALLFKELGSGHLVVSLHSPTNNNGSGHILNTYLVACQRPVLLTVHLEGADIKVTDNLSLAAGDQPVIPAGEPVSADVTFRIVSLGGGDLGELEGGHVCAGSSLALFLFMPESVEEEILEGSCTYDPNLDIGLVAPSPIPSGTKGIVCCAGPEIGLLDTFKIVFRASISGENTAVQGYDIPLVGYGVQYNISGVLMSQVDVILVRAAEAARIEAVLNPEPSSWYPLLGRGQDTDSVLVAENKAMTSAKEVMTSLVFLLITPIVDGSDQKLLARAALLDRGYYNATSTSTYYPGLNWLDGEQADNDILDFNILHGRHSFLAADWDTPAKLNLEQISPDPEEEDSRWKVKEIPNSSYSVTVRDNDILRQRYFSNADVVLEHAVQRLVAFVDPAEEGVIPIIREDMYIPDNDLRPSSPNQGKSNIIFARNDLYFLSHAIYPPPENLGLGAEYDNFVITCDRIKTEPGTSGGTYDGEEGSYSKEGLVASHWKNKLLLDESVNILRFIADEEGVLGDARDYKGNREGFDSARTYGLFPIDSSNGVSSPTDIIGFGTDGHHETYWELGFVKALSINLPLPADKGLRGGIIEIVLDGGLLEAVNSFNFEPYASFKKPVSVSADKIAVKDTGIHEGQDGKTIVTFTFLRGLTPEELDGKVAELIVNVLIGAECNPPASIVSVSIKELSYVLGGENGGHSFGEPENLDITEITAVEQPMFILPAIEIKFSRSTGAAGETDESGLAPLEYVDPLTRVGTYTQELFHRPLHGSLEIHTRERPLVTLMGGFTVYQSIGTSSIPFRSLVSTGKALVIPSTPLTSCIEWSDLWGRRFSQPLRTVIPDVPPIPPPVRSFVMGESYELLDAQGNRLDYWPSDEAVDLHVTLKLRNGYPKYFEITNCEKNNILHLCKGVGCPGARPHVATDDGGNIIDPTGIYDLSEDDKSKIEVGKTYHSHWTHKTRYGVCYGTTDAKMSGEWITAEDAEHLASDALSGCEGRDCKGLSRKPNGEQSNDPWNYSALVDEYYPTGYINKTSMWDLTHEDYADNLFEKAYPYHLDNTIPSPASGGKDKPDNLVYYGIPAGLGFSVSYDKNKKNPGFGGGQMSGWYSNQLQGKDHTLLAGQEKSSGNAPAEQVSMVQPTDITLVKDLDVEEGAKSKLMRRLNNRYVCHYNPYVFTKYTEGRFSYVSNIYKNYVVPIDPRDTTSSVSNYNCAEDAVVYDPSNISQVDNSLIVGSRNYLYFGVALRGEAREDIHILTTIKPGGNVLPVTGDVKVSEGSYLNYWNPANGPNSFQQVLCPAIPVNARSNYITITAKTLSPSTTTFDSVVYSLVTISDPLQPATISAGTESLFNTRGYGDMMVETYTGGWNGFKAVLTYDSNNLPQRTVVRIEFNNNIGYDIELKPEAMSYASKNSTSTEDVRVSAVIAPTSYNFISPVFDGMEDLKNCLDIKPFAFVDGAAPQFFDFPNTNPMIIKDGWKATFFYEVTLTCSLAGTMHEGRLAEIPLVIDSNYFVNWPGTEEKPMNPPPMKIGFGYESGASKGDVLYCPTGQITNLGITPSLVADGPFTLVNAMAITPDELIRLENASLQLDALAAMDEEYSKLLEEHGENIFETVPFNPQFDVYDNRGTLLFVIKSTATFCPSGRRTLFNKTTAEFLDFRGKLKNAVEPGTNDKTYADKLSIQAKGAWMSMTASTTITVDVTEQDEEGNSIIIPTVVKEIPAGATAWLNITINVTNSGDGVAFRVNPTFNLDKYGTEAPTIEVISDGTPSGSASTLVPTIIDNGDKWEITFNINRTIFQGSQVKLSFRTPAPVINPDDIPDEPVVKVVTHKASKNDTKSESEAVEEEPVIVTKTIVVLSGGSINMDLTENENEKNVNQPVTPKLTVTYSKVVEEKPDPIIPVVKNNKGIIIISCSVGGSCVLVAIIVTLAVCLTKRRKNREHKADDITDVTDNGNKDEGEAEENEEEEEEEKEESKHIESVEEDQNAAVVEQDIQYPVLELPPFPISADFTNRVNDLWFNEPVDPLSPQPVRGSE